MSNLVTACYGCNQRKGKKTVEEAGMVLLAPLGSPARLLTRIASIVVEAERSDWPVERMIKELVLLDRVPEIV